MMRLLKAVLLISVLVVLPLVVFSQESSRSPMYFLAAREEKCSATTMEVRGATNLPKGAVVAVVASRMVQNGWSEATERFYATVDAKGLFSAQLRPKAGERFELNMFVQVFFGPVYHAQPQSVIDVVGKKGERLGNFDNPQFGQLSGENYYLATVARVEWCGR